MDLIDKIITTIEANRISSTEIGDVLGKTGQIKNVHPLNRGFHKVGEVVVIYATNNSNYEVHRQLADIDISNKILYVHNINCTDAIFGDLVSKYILLYKRAKAIVVNGLLRDAHTLIKENYPIWLSGVSPIGCVNHINGPEISKMDYDDLFQTYNGAIMVCDDSGVVMIPKDKICPSLISKLDFIEFQEDIWFYCLDTLKMSTFDIVCKKKYLTDDIISSDRLAKLEEIRKNIE